MAHFIRARKRSTLFFLESGEWTARRLVSKVSVNQSDQFSSATRSGKTAVIQQVVRGTYAVHVSLDCRMTRTFCCCYNQTMDLKKKKRYDVNRPSVLMEPKGKKQHSKCLSGETFDGNNVVIPSNICLSLKIHCLATSCKLHCFSYYLGI